VSVQTETTTYTASDGVAVTTYSRALTERRNFPRSCSATSSGHARGGRRCAAHARRRATFRGGRLRGRDSRLLRGARQQPTMEGGTIVGSPSDEQSTSDLCDAVHWLQRQTFVDPDRVGVIGWCGGGRRPCSWPQSATASRPPPRSTDGRSTGRRCMGRLRSI